MNWTSRRKIGLYLALTALFSLPGYYVAAYPGNLTPRTSAAVMMWAPGLAGLAVRLWTEGTVAGIGWRPNRPVWLLIALALPLGYALPPYLLAWASGLATFAPERWVAALPYGIVAGSAASALTLILTVGLFDKFSRALGEEIGWRGLLVPELLKITSLRTTALVSGLIWGAWHVPAMVTGDYHATGTPLSFQIACFVVGIVAESFLYAWLTYRSASVWPAVLLHAAHNLIVQSVLDQATADRGGAAWVTGEFGAGMVVTAIVAAWWLTRRDAAATHATVRPMPSR